MKKYDALSFLIGNEQTIDEMIENGGWPVRPFSDEITGFLDRWSELIRHIPRERKDPAAAAFGFWCRRAGIAQISRDYQDVIGGSVGKGICLQFVPNNIPALFAYSLTAALLAGNSVIMRLPQGFDSSSVLMETLRAALADCPEAGRRVVLIKYPHDQKITDWLSGQCDIRVIWGGNVSIADIQRSALTEDANDIVFPDRHSMAVISAEAVLKEKDISAFVRDFYNDTYLNDQNACSSPNIIVWLGNENDIAAAKIKFWTELNGFLNDRYVLQEETAVRKLEQAMMMAGLGLAVKISSEGSIVRVETAGVSAGLWEFAANGGFFMECCGEQPDLIKDLLTPACQTIAYFQGEEGPELERSIRTVAEGCGNFRIVPAGHTLDFSLIWDGQDLIRQMVRKQPGTE